MTAFEKGKCTIGYMTQLLSVIQQSKNLLLSHESSFFYVTAPPSLSVFLFLMVQVGSSPCYQKNEKTTDRMGENTYKS